MYRYLNLKRAGSRNELILQYDKDPEDEMDELSVNILTSHCPDGLVPFQRVVRDETVLLEYTMKDTITLGQKLSGALKKSDVYMILTQLLHIILHTEKELLPLDFFLLNTDAIFYDNANASFKMLYVPVVIKQAETITLRDFFLELLRSMRCMDEDTRDFAKQIYDYIRQSDLREVDSLLNYIEQQFSHFDPDLMREDPSRQEEKIEIKVQDLSALADQIRNEQRIQVAVQGHHYTDEPKDTGSEKEEEGDRFKIVIPGVTSEQDWDGEVKKQKPKKQKTKKEKREKKKEKTPEENIQIDTPKTKKEDRKKKKQKETADNPQRAGKEKKAHAGIKTFFRKIMDEEEYLEDKYSEGESTDTDRPADEPAAVDQKENPPHSFLIIDEMENDHAGIELADHKDIPQSEDRHLQDGQRILGGYSLEESVVLDRGQMELKPAATLTSVADGSLHPIHTSEYKIGRNYYKCDLVSKINTVGRIHATILCKQNRFYVRDEHSMNGTYLNGSREPITPGKEVQLHDGDEICFAEDKYVIKIDDRENNENYY